MRTLTGPIAVSTTLSILLHGTAIAAVLLVYEQASTTGQGIEIQLVSSILVADQQETEMPRKHEASLAVADRIKKPAQEQRSRPQSRLASLVLSETGPVNKGRFTGQHDVQRDTTQEQLNAAEGTSVAQLARSTNASQQQHSILELLHARISDNKKYPYMARRHRREGVATIGFVLHPDGTIDNAHLVATSSAAALDRAALSAVKRIEPFIPAQEYLDQAKVFQIDVVFNLL